MNRQDLLRINVTSLGVLTLGFLNSLLVPRIAILSMGVEAYGHYALLLGYCLVPTLADLGLVPGLTRELGRLHATEGPDSARGAALLHRVRSLVILLGVGLTLLAAAAAITFHGRQAGVGLAVLLGGAANVTAAVTDLALIRVRVAGRVAAATILKGAYYVAMLVGVVALASVTALTPAWLFSAQLLAALVYAALGARVARPSTSGSPATATEEVPWRGLAAAALPEQLARLQSALLPSAERGLLLQLGGAANLAAYDVALRLSALVSAAPAALTEPLVALLAPRMSHGRSAERGAILRHGTQAVFLTALGALALALPATWTWAPAYYHLEGTSVRLFIAAIMIGSAVNVLSAPVVALMYASGRPGPVTAKGLADLGAALAALAAAFSFRSSALYVVVRFGSFCLTAPGLWLSAFRLLPDTVSQFLPSHFRSTTSSRCR